MNFSLGAAQFGLNYGITNHLGQVKAIELQKILSYAKHNNIQSIDTAIEYGDSEISLGKANISDWKVVTKIFYFLCNLFFSNAVVIFVIFKSL